LKDTALEWTEQNPIGTVVGFKGADVKLPHKVASHAFWPPRPSPCVLLEDGSAVCIHVIEKIENQQQTNPTRPGAEKAKKGACQAWGVGLFSPTFLDAAIAAGGG